MLYCLTIPQPSHVKRDSGPRFFQWRKHEKTEHTVYLLATRATVVSSDGGPTESVDIAPRRAARKRERKRASPSRSPTRFGADRAGSAAPPRRDRHPMERRTRTKGHAGGSRIRRTRWCQEREGEGRKKKNRTKECRRQANLRIQLSRVSTDTHSGWILANKFISGHLRYIRERLKPYRRLIIKVQYTSSDKTSNINIVIF